MRGGQPRRQYAISNSPFVRSVIRPVRVAIVPNGTASGQHDSSTAMSSNLNRSTTADDGIDLSSAATEQSDKPHDSFLLPTQPLAVTTGDAKVGTSDLKRKKRARDDDANTDVNNAHDAQAQLVKTRYTQDELPADMTKYWHQRYRLFSLFDEGCELDLEGWFSVTPEKIAQQIAERCRTNVIVDAFCGVGGNAIQFAMTCEKVIAIDNSPVRLRCAKRNAEIYGVADHIQFVLADFVEWTNEYLVQKSAGLIPQDEQVEVVFMSPPWGGVDYQTLGNGADVAMSGQSAMTAGAAAWQNAKARLQKQRRASNELALATDTEANESTEEQLDPTPPTSVYPLSALKPLPGTELFALARRITPHVAMYLPRNSDVFEIARLPALAPRTDQPDLDEHRLAVQGSSIEYSEPVEIEEEWMWTKLKAVTAYFGDLATNSPTSWVAQDDREER
ncbi:putative diacylglycerol O-acyltransferase tgs1 [Microbotryomycetes sp. JL221]|nr:putative diacylglycerol O-acyltransferase tgs1 [Microbotryomycetes sp. JL221]